MNLRRKLLKYLSCTFRWRKFTNDAEGSRWGEWGEYPNVKEYSMWGEFTNDEGCKKQRGIAFDKLLGIIQAGVKESTIAAIHCLYIYFNEENWTYLFGSPLAAARACLADSRNLTEKGGLLPAFFQELWGHRKTIFHLLKELVQNKETKDDIRNEALSMYNIIEYQHKNSLRIAVVGHIINYFESSEATYLKGFLEYFKREGISHLKGFFDCYGHILNDSDLNSRDFQDFLSEIWGSIIQFLEKFAQNKNIDDDVRASSFLSAYDARPIGSS